jgi:hypothetical protein
VSGLIRSLSIHADYRCRHAGACCTAGWPIPVDDRLKEVLTDEVRRRTLAAATSDRAAPIFLIAPNGQSSIGHAAGACVFYEAHTTRLCAIHRQLGEACLPPSCRHFPRVALLDGRGVSITLSHYCPTAAAMLLRDEVPLSIVSGPPAFPAGRDYEGLDARGVLPPLLRPGLLWDLEGYSRWEEEAVAVLARPGLGPEQALELLRRAATEIEGWRPDTGSLGGHVSAAFSRADVPVPEGSRWGDAGRVVNRYLAARLFASWVPYKSERLLALVDDLCRAHALLVREAARQDLVDAIRAVDLRIVHTADQNSLVCFRGVGASLPAS